MWKYLTSSINLFYYFYKNLILRKLKEIEFKK
jgi:hypothetical protein